MFSHFYHNSRFSTQLVEMDLGILTSLKFQTQWKIVHLIQCITMNLKQQELNTFALKESILSFNLDLHLFISIGVCLADPNLIRDKCFDFGKVFVVLQFSLLTLWRCGWVVSLGFSIATFICNHCLKDPFTLHHYRIESRGTLVFTHAVSLLFQKPRWVCSHIFWLY